jgi:hypothetical protein
VPDGVVRPGRRSHPPRAGLPDAGIGYPEGDDRPQSPDEVRPPAGEQQQAKRRHHHQTERLSDPVERELERPENSHEGHGADPHESGPPDRRDDGPQGDARVAFTESVTSVDVVSVRPHAHQPPA